MPTALAHEPIGPAAGASPVAAADARLLRALLRWRMRRILRALPMRARRLSRLMPSLFHGIFSTLDLRGEPPGIESWTPHRSWLALGRDFGLPAPTGTQRGRRTVRAIVALPGPDEVELVVVPVPGVRAPELDVIRKRLEVARGLLQRNRVPLAIRLAEDAPHEDDRFGLRLLLFGGLLAGGLPSHAFDSLHVDTPDTLCHLVDAAPTRIAAGCLMMLRPGSTSAAVLTLLRAHGQGHSAALLSDPELFCAAWASRRKVWGMLPLEAVRIAGADAVSRRTAAAWLEASPPETRLDPRRKPGVTQGIAEAAAVVAIARAVTGAAAKAVRSHPLSESRALRARFRAEFLPPRGVPKFLWPSLDAAVVQLGPVRLGPLIALGGGEAAQHLETRLVRGLALLGDAADRAAAALDAPWPKLALRLEGIATKRTFVLTAGVRELDSPPLDPLNRGPERRNSLRNSLAVTLSDTRRPTARQLLPAEGVRRMVAEARRGTNVEVLGEDPKSEPAVSRLSRLAVRTGAASRQGMSLAIEVGGDVVVPDADGIRLYGLAPFLARPRRYSPDPESPDLGAASGHVGGAARGTVDCLVVHELGRDAVLIYCDENGYRIRETVPPERLEAHLAEGRELLRKAPQPKLLTVRLGGDGKGLLSRAPAAEPVAIGVEGELVHGLRVTLLGERYGRGRPMAWAGAATALLSVWPAHTDPVLRFASFDVSVRGAPCSGLALLYARSVVRRRLGLHMRPLSYT